MLYGREEEERRIRALLENAAAGHSGLLAIIAEPGAGKSALLDFATALTDSTWRVLRCTSMEGEAELPFAGLQLLLAAVLEDLPDPAALRQRQRAALLAAFGATDEQGPDFRFLVGLGAKTLLAALSARGPVLCLVDDAQWLDQPSLAALLFAARRLSTERVAILLAGGVEFPAAGLAQLRLGPLDDAAARRLLADQHPGLPPEVRERVLVAAAGNPLALRELSAMDIDAMAPGPLPLPDRLQTGYLATISELPEAARLALLVAAAAETGDLALVLRVLADLGSSAQALDAAERSGLVTVGGQTIRFVHPLARSAAYRSAPFTQRIAVHAAVAAALVDQPDRRAWHLAAAASGPDETAAAALEATARRTPTATEAWERSARLSPAPADRIRRLVRAAETAADAGMFGRALRLADEIANLPGGTPAVAARLAEVRTRAEIECGSLRSAYPLLTGNAAQIAPHAPLRAAALLIVAGAVAWTAGDPAGVGRARTAVAELSLGAERRAVLELLDGPLALAEDDPGAGVRIIRGTVRRGAAIFADAPAIRLLLAGQAAAVGDLEEARDGLLTLSALYRERGLTGRLPAVGGALGTVEMLLGHFPEADATLTECLRIAQDTDQPNRIGQAQSVLAVLAAIHGDAERCRERAAQGMRHALGEDNAVDIAHAQWALALLDLGEGRYEAALDRLEALHREPNRALGQWVHLLSDQIEAAVRLRRPERAQEPLTRLRRWAEATGSSWIQAHLLRGRAVLGEPECFAAALSLPTIGRYRYDRARTGLLYGEWLRRERSKVEARSLLRTALADFERLDARPWADRARAELRAAGESAGTETESELATRLTPQELQVVRLAAAGATNKEIGARLLLSPKTVAHHLYRAFPKLGITNRRELTQADPDLGLTGS